MCITLGWDSESKICMLTKVGLVDIFLPITLLYLFIQPLMGYIRNMITRIFSDMPGGPGAKATRRGAKVRRPIL